MSSALTALTGTIPRGKPPAPGLDYAALRTEGINLIQAMCGDIWTDYNYSDPGVTILEQLCYALTELSYRAYLPVQELLADPRSGRVDLYRQALYPARAILPCNPVTLADYRRLILDRVPEVANVWFTPAAVTTASDVNALYDVAVLLHERNPCAPGRDRAAILHRIRACYNRHRALGEDVRAITALDLLTTHVFADVRLADEADPVTVLAQLLFHLGLALAPEPRRASLDEMLKLGLSSAEIFTGPLLTRGFIAAGALSAQPQAIPVNNLLQLMSEVPGALTIAGLKVEVQDTPKPYLPGDVITLPANAICSLCVTPREQTFTIRLLHGGAVCQPDPAAVERQLARLWAAQRQTHFLWAEYAAHFRLTRAVARPLTAYSSVQEQFPNVYGINSFGLPPEASATRRAQARQLKGYLMVFDQLMADFFAQLGFLRELFSLQAGGADTYAWQSLAPIVPDVAPLLVPGYKAGLASLAGRKRAMPARQRQIIDLLLSLYASVLPHLRGGDCNQPAPDPMAPLRASRSLLERIVPATRDRGRGFDYAAQGFVRGHAGLLIRVHAELAALAGTDRAAPTTHGHPSFGRLLPSAAGAALAARLIPVEVTGDPDELNENFYANPLADHVVAPALLPALADIRRFRLGRIEGDADICLICQDNEDNWWLIGQYQDAVSTLGACAAIVRAARQREAPHEIQLVEWVLLRAALLPGDTAMQYNFRVTAVLADRDEAPVWRRQACAILRANLPAHLALDCLFLGPQAMHEFRRRHRHWCAALRTRGPDRAGAASLALQTFLQSHTPTVPQESPP
jgi:hypothetical protein